MNDLYGIDPGPEKSAMVRCKLTPREELDGDWALPWGVVPVEWSYDHNTRISQSITADHEFYTAPGPRPAIGIETMDFSKGMAGLNVMDTQLWAGRFWSETLQSGRRYVRINERSATSQLTGLPNGSDGDVRRAILYLYGESLDSIKGRKCQACKGKAWRGQDHKPCETCLDHFGLMYPKGPLFGWHGKAWPHIYAALSTALRTAWEIGTKD